MVDEDLFTVVLVFLAGRWEWKRLPGTIFCVMFGVTPQN
jgi:hypothetical protein